MARKRSTPKKRPVPAANASSRGKTRPHPELRGDTASQLSFPIVGVGASAGGLEAFTELLTHLPSNPGMAFVLIQHLDPHQPSHLTDLLSKASSMPVLEIKSNVRVQANHVYVMAPGVSLSVADGQLRAKPRGPGLQLPIDFFLRSLASEKTSNAIGVVLSGTASDGTLGLKAVKAEGGITFVQDPSSAKFDGMPRSAVAAGVADFVLPPADIAKRLVKLARHPYVVDGQPGRRDDDTPQEVDFDVNRIFHLLRNVTGNDFTHYKQSTVRRRIHRRMVLHADSKLSDYVTYLQEDHAEVRALAGDLLICVTSFFREPQAFDLLAGKVFPMMLKNRSPDDAIRIWVPACATGEEAYSVAICLTEVLEASGANVPIQIFATDVSEVAIDKARAGKYGASALADVSPTRLKRFFGKIDGGYQIDKSIRETCIFAKQNITKDPPFRTLDLISCCNVLIYFGPILQRKTLSVFHYALKPNGFLLLGPSETASALPKGFVTSDKKVKLYTKLGSEQPLNFRYAVNDSPTGEVPAEPARDNVRVALDIQKTAERMLLAQYAPAGVIVDDALNVVHVRGTTGPYLQLAPGEPTYNLLKMAREGLIPGLRTLFVKAKQGKTAVTHQVRVKQNGGFRDISLKVIPINGPGRDTAEHFIILFEDVKTSSAVAATGDGDEAPGQAAKTKPDKTARASSRENVRLSQELASTKEYLQSIIEEQEATTEELKSANEEAQASNEELQTSQEELQSANEELNTVNEELKGRNSSLSEVNSDLSNVLSSINVPLLIVGKDLKIRRFTQAMTPMLNLVDSDVGRSILDFKLNIDLPDLAELLRSVINGNNPAPRDIFSSEGRWYSLQLLSYRAPSGRVDGALMVLFDIHSTKLSRDYADAIVETVQQPLVVLSKDLKLIRANAAFYQTFRISKEDAENRLLYDVGNGGWHIPQLREGLEQILPQRRELRDFEVDHEFREIGQRTLLINGREILQPPPYGKTILLVIEDVTERTARQREEVATRERTLIAERVLRGTEAELARITRAFALGEMATSIAHEVNQPLAGVVTNAEAALRWLGGETPDVHEAKDSLALIIRDGNRAAEVVRRIRKFLKKERQETVELNINECIRGAIALAHHDLVQRRIVLHTQLSGDVPVLRGDSIQLQQVVLNLMMNGAEAMESNGGSKDLFITSYSSDAGARVAVCDHGVGINPQDMHRIFDAFFTNKPTGIGMGLSISRSIIEEHGGRIWVEPNDGPGVTVQFSLPAAGAPNQS